MRLMPPPWLPLIKATRPSRFCYQVPGRCNGFLLAHAPNFLRPSVCPSLSPSSSSLSLSEYAHHLPQQRCQSPAVSRHTFAGGNQAPDPSRLCAVPCHGILPPLTHPHKTHTLPAPSPPAIRPVGTILRPVIHGLTTKACKS
ncbi:unnamed protein product [Ectocarpus sp. 8 AP-2014]